MSRDQLINFGKTIAGKYTNKTQAQLQPKKFAHINIYFQPLPWSVLKGPGFYSEQSFDYSPWTPYRQSVHMLSIKNGVFIMNNFLINEAIRVAGGGFNRNLLTGLAKINLKLRSGCSMHF